MDIDVIFAWFPLVLACRNQKGRQSGREVELSVSLSAIERAQILLSFLARVSLSVSAAFWTTAENLRLEAVG